MSNESQESSLLSKLLATAASAKAKAEAARLRAEVNEAKAKEAQDKAEAEAAEAAAEEATNSLFSALADKTEAVMAEEGYNGVTQFMGAVTKFVVGTTEEQSAPSTPAPNPEPTEIPADQDESESLIAAKQTALEEARRLSAELQAAQQRIDELHEELEHLRTMPPQENDERNELTQARFKAERDRNVAVTALKEAEGELKKVQEVLDNIPHFPSPNMSRRSVLGKVQSDEAEAKMTVKAWGYLQEHVWGPASEVIKEEDDNPPTSISVMEGNPPPVM